MQNVFRCFLVYFETTEDFWRVAKSEGWLFSGYFFRFPHLFSSGDPRIRYIRRYQAPSVIAVNTQTVNIKQLQTSNTLEERISDHWFAQG